MEKVSYGNLCWKVESKCNMECSMCFRERRHEIIRGYEEKTLKEAKRLGFKTVVFTGGEPTLRPDLPELVQAAIRHGFDVRVDTNGILLDDELLLKLKGITLLGLPLHGSCPEVHDWIVGRPGHFKIIMERAKRAKQLGIGIRITTVASKENLADLTRIAELLSSKVLPDIWGVTRVMKRSLDEDKFNKISISQDEFMAAVKDLPEQHKYRLVLSNQDAADRAYIFVNPDFTVSTTTGDTRKTLGDLKKDSFRSIMSNSGIDMAKHVMRAKLTNIK